MPVASTDEEEEEVEEEDIESFTFLCILVIQYRLSNIYKFQWLYTLEKEQKRGGEGKQRERGERIKNRCKCELEIVNDSK